MEFQLLAMNDSVGLLILVVGMAVAVALIALLESKMNAPQPAASVPEERHAPAAPAKAAPAPAPAVDPKAGKVPARGSLGDVDLHTVDDRTAAILMAIVADKMGAPLNELRFISITEIQ